MFSKVSKLLLLLLCLCAVYGAAQDDWVLPPSAKAPAPYPEWAHSHWVWLDSHEANQQSEIELVKGYLDRNISVGAVDIDSAWSTGFNNFIFDTRKYPDPKGMVATFHSLGVRVILWATSLINTDSSNYAEAVAKNYILTGLFENTVKWWHGHGSFIDYTNPQALAWWHAQLDNVLKLGIDGWKCDGTDPFVWELIEAYGYGDVVVSEEEYARLYYEDFFNYTRTKNPQSLIMSRPVDSLGPIYLSFSPRSVVYSGWVGDQDATFDGLQNALRNMFHSAWRNYVNFGSDIGGYRATAGPLGRTKELLIRWAQLGAFVPLMENGGGGEHRPWKFDSNNQTVNIYRKFVDIHTELLPYFLEAGSTAFETGVSVIRPLADWTIFTPDTWAYMLWKDILVVPMVDNSTYRNIDFPSGNDWVDWWNSTCVYRGGTQNVNYSVPLEKFPVFHRKGSVLPLHVFNDGAEHGDYRQKDMLTLLIPYLTATGEQTIRAFYGEKSYSQEIRYEFNERALVITATPHPRPIVLLLRGVAVHPSSLRVTAALRQSSLSSPQQLNPKSSREDLFDNGSGWFYNPTKAELWVLPGNTQQGLRLTISNIANLPSLQC